MHQAVHLFFTEAAVLGVMKTVLLGWLLLLTYAGNAQSVPTAGDSVTTAGPLPLYAATVPTASISSTELYLRAKLWLLNNHSIGRYKWLGDRNTSLIAVKGTYFLPAVGFSGTWLYYSLKLLFSNGSYHYAITDIYFRKNGATETLPAEQLLPASPERRVNRRYQEALGQQVGLLLSSLQSGMQQPTAL